MTWQSAIAAAEARIRAYAAQLVANVVDFAPGTRASADGSADGVAGLPTTEQSQTDVRRVQHAGFRSRLARHIGGVIVKHGTRYFQIAEDDGQTVALDEGESVVYAPGKPSARIRFKVDQDVTVNEGTAAVGRVGDQVKVTIPVGTVGVTIVGGVLQMNPAPIELTGTITAGADHFKA